MKILLFDIDGTLISTGGAGYRAMTRAFESVFNIPDGLQGISLSGMTDRIIFKNACTARQIEWQKEQEDQFKSLYLKFLSEEIKKPNPKKYICPGIGELLPRLQEIPEVHLGLLTGNFARGAEIKLEAFDLYKFFDFGAYGDDNGDRNLLFNYAVERLQQKTGIVPRGDQVWIIGDTPRDIACARPHQAWSVAVATGVFSAAQLEAENPHFLFNDLSDSNAFLQIFNSKN